MCDIFVTIHEVLHGLLTNVFQVFPVYSPLGQKNKQKIIIVIIIIIIIIIYLGHFT